MSEEVDLRAMGSPTPASRSLRRKPVPTPRNTLKKPALSAAKKKLPDQDSQGQTSVDSTSPDDESQSGRGTSRAVGAGGVGGEDILAALEKIPGVGSLRSVQSSIGSSLPSLSLERIKREESSHSLRSAPDGQSPEKEGIKRERSLRVFHTEQRPRTRRLLSSDAASSASPMSKLSSVSKVTQNGHGEDDGESEEALHDHDIGGKKEEQRKSLSELKGSPLESPPILRKSKVEAKTLPLKTTKQALRDSIQTRPLPELPKIMPSKVSPAKSGSKDTADEISVIHSDSGDTGGGENGVYSTLLSPDHYTELTPLSTSTPAAKIIPARSPRETHTLLKPASIANSGYLTLTGTMRKNCSKRHKKSPNSTRPNSDQEPLYDVQLNLTQEHLDKLEKRVHDKYHDRCFCGVRRGIHIFVVSLLFFPFMWIYSTFLSFYLGTITWYNIFIHYNEERGCCAKLLSPFVLLLYPFWIVPITLFLGMYGGVAQISWYFDGWIKALRTPDGGFFEWFCESIDIPDASPFQVILLSATDYERPPTGATVL